MDLQSIRPTNQLVPGKYAASWYPMLPGSSTVLILSSGRHCRHCHCVASI